jgi:hypothetical protein
LVWSICFLHSSLRACFSLVISSISDIHWKRNTCKIKFSKNSGDFFRQYWAIYISYQIHRSTSTLVDPNPNSSLTINRMLTVTLAPFVVISASSMVTKWKVMGHTRWLLQYLTSGVRHSRFYPIHIYIYIYRKK